MSNQFTEWSILALFCQKYVKRLEYSIIFGWFGSGWFVKIQTTLCSKSRWPKLFIGTIYILRAQFNCLLCNSRLIHIDCKSSFHIILPSFRLMWSLCRHDPVYRYSWAVDPSESHRDRKHEHSYCWSNLESDCLLWLLHSGFLDLLLHRPV